MQPPPQAATPASAPADPAATSTPPPVTPALNNAHQGKIGDWLSAGKWQIRVLNTTTVDAYEDHYDQKPRRSAPIGPGDTLVIVNGQATNNANGPQIPFWAGQMNNTGLTGVNGQGFAPVRLDVRQDVAGGPTSMPPNTWSAFAIAFSVPKGTIPGVVVIGISRTDEAQVALSAPPATPAVLSPPPAVDSALSKAHHGKIGEVLSAGKWQIRVLNTIAVDAYEDHYDQRPRKSVPLGSGDALVIVNCQATNTANGPQIPFWAGQNNNTGLMSMNGEGFPPVRLDVRQGVGYGGPANVPPNTWFPFAVLFSVPKGAMPAAVVVGISRTDEVHVSLK